MHISFSSLDCKVIIRSCFQNWYIKSTSSQVKNKNFLSRFKAFLVSKCNSGGSGLVKNFQNFQLSLICSSYRSLFLLIIKISRYGDDCLRNRLAIIKFFLSYLFYLFENQGWNLFWGILNISGTWLNLHINLGIVILITYNFEWQVLDVLLYGGTCKFVTDQTLSIKDCSEWEFGNLIICSCSD